MLSNLILWAGLAILVTSSAAMASLAVLLIRSREGMDAVPAGVLTLLFIGSAWSIAQHLGV